MTTRSIPPADSTAIHPYGTTLLTRRQGHKSSILLTCLHRPKVKNAFNDEQYSDLIHLLEDVGCDESVHAIVLTGTGDYFSSGADLTDMDFESELDTVDKPSGRFMMALLAFEKVFVAAVNGPAVGIGVTLLMHCDLVYCTGDATFWVPFTRIALVPEFCSSVTFVEAMGMSNANELLLLGKKINAERAVLDRIVSGIVDVNITNSSAKDDSNAFASESIGSKVCQELDERLFQLCHGDKSAGIFVKMIRGRSKRRRDFEILCREELSQLDKRLRSGEVLEAALNLNLSKNSKL